MAKQEANVAAEGKEAAKQMKMTKRNPNAKPRKNKNKLKTKPNAAAPQEKQPVEERPLMVRVLTVGVASYLAHKVWTKRKTLTAGWYTEEQSETESGVVTVFEYLSSMGLIFVVGIVVGVLFSKVAKWIKGAPATE